MIIGVDLILCGIEFNSNTSRYNVYVYNIESKSFLKNKSMDAYFDSFNYLLPIPETIDLDAILQLFRKECPILDDAPVSSKRSCKKRIIPDEATASDSDREFLDTMTSNASRRKAPRATGKSSNSSKLSKTASKTTAAASILSSLSSEDYHIDTDNIDDEYINQASSHRNMNPRNKRNFSGGISTDIRSREKEFAEMQVKYSENLLELESIKRKRRNEPDDQQLLQQLNAIHKELESQRRKSELLEVELRQYRAGDQLEYDRELKATTKELQEAHIKNTEYKTREEVESATSQKIEANRTECETKQKNAEKQRDEDRDKHEKQRDEDRDKQDQDRAKQDQDRREERKELFQYLSEERKELFALIGKFAPSSK